MRRLHPEEREKLLIHDNPVGVLLVDAQGEIFEANESFARFVGRSIEQVIGRNVSELWHADHGGARAVRDSLLAPDQTSFGVERRYVKPDGAVVHGLLHVRRVRASDGDTFFLAYVVDVSGRKAAEEELRVAQSSDRLTGLASRRLLLETLEESAREPVPLGLVVLGLDGFSTVNEGLGPEAADRTLESVAQRLFVAFGEEACVARLGGDEFGIVCAEKKAIEVAERARQVVAEDPAEGLTASVGVRTANGGDRPHQVLRDALLAMHRAKELGRNRVVAFEDAMRETISRKVSIVRALRRALVARDIEFAYQPIYQLSTARIVGLEALARWDDADLGTVEPSEFVPLAEQHGMIGRLGELAVERAVGVLGRLPGISVSINVSSAQLRDEHHAASFEALVEAQRGTGRRLHVEITESVFIDRSSGVLRKIDRLKEAGAKLWLDDFGTGFASLTALHELPFDGIKIDRSFVKRLASEPRSRSVVSALLRLARDLGLDCVAEGVEDDRTLSLLADLGCDKIQGFLMGRPTSIADLEGSDRLAVVA